MSNSPHSLRSRIQWALLGLAALIGPLVAVAILFLSVEAQEWFVEWQVANQLRDAPDTPMTTDGGGTSGDVPVHIVGETPHRSMPRALLELPDGIHEYETTESAWVIGLVTAEGVRYATIRDTTALEQREQQALLYALSGGALATLLAIVVARRVAKRLTAPLESLAETVRDSEPDDTIIPPPEACESMEARTLANALERYQRRMRDALDRERRFAADVSHELRTPLTIIDNATEILGADPALSSASLRAMSRINNAVRRMQETTLVLLALIREPGADNGHPAVDVAGRLGGVVDNESEGARGVNAPPAVYQTITASSQVHAPEAVVDMIIGNLVRNALTHSQASRIDITLGDGQLRVADDGVGFPPDALEAENDHDGPTPSDRHTGLGLSLMRRLCRRFGWTLRLENAPRGGAVATWAFG